MGKRSQAEGKWLTGSQRAARGEAKSGALMYGTTNGTPVTRKALAEFRAMRGRQDQEEKAARERESQAELDRRMAAERRK